MSDILLICVESDKIALLHKLKQLYENSPVGRNTLGNTVKDMCREAGIERKNNHSLRATGATATFQANVPDKIIQKTTGHRSIEALRSYERISTQQHQAVSRVLMSNRSFEKELEPSKPTLAPVAPAHARTVPGFSQLFGSLQNCTIGRLMVNVNPAAITVSGDEEFEK